MRIKAITDLDQLPDKGLFEEVADGLNHVADHTLTLDSQARVLFTEGKSRGARILRAIAKEEAAKYLILIDAVRCPRIPGSSLFPTHLRRFNDHLAKGIYAHVCNLRPGTLGELHSWIDQERKEYYLDGPNDVDWIFSNRLVREREESFYVDYTENDGLHLWITPQPWDDLSVGLFHARPPAVIALVEALHKSGLSNSTALTAVADSWRAVETSDSLHWQSLRKLNLDTLHQLEERGLLGTAPDEIYRRVMAP